MEFQTLFLILNGRTEGQAQSNKGLRVENGEIDVTSISFSKKHAVFQHLAKEIIVVQNPFESSISAAVSNENDDLSNDTPYSSRRWR